MSTRYLFIQTRVLIFVWLLHLSASEKSVKVLWDHFRQDDPNAGFHFEKFLSNISDSIHNKEKEKVDMEEFIKTQNETREEEVIDSLMTIRSSKF